MQTLHALENWLKTHLPEVIDDLKPGATAAALDDFASTLGLRLPADFVQLYRWHDGQEMAVNTGPWYGLNFLPLARVQSECEMWRDVRKEMDPESLADLDSQMQSTPAGHVKKQYANALWIPFAYDWGGNYLGIDLDPDVQGTYGQVISFGRDEERKIAVAPSIAAFVDWMLAELDAGNFHLQEEDDGGRSFNTLRPQKFHFLDSLADLFPER